VLALRRANLGKSGNAPDDVAAEDRRAFDGMSTCPAFVATPNRLSLLTLSMPDPHQRGLDFGRRRRCVPPSRNRRTDPLETATHGAFPMKGLASRFHCVTGSFKERDSNPRPDDY